MAYDYVQGALPQDPAEISVAGIPDDADLNGRSEKLVQSGTAMRLARLNPQERDLLGGPSSVEEQDLNQTYADFADAVPELMDELGEPKTALRDTVNMEGALGQAAGATEQLAELAGTGAVLLAAEVTSNVDDVSEAVARIKKEGTEAQQRQVQTVLYPVEQIRTETQAHVQARQGRKRLRQTRHDAALVQSAGRQELLQKVEALQGAALPGAGSAESAGAPGHGVVGIPRQPAAGNKPVKKPAAAKKPKPGKTTVH